MNHCCVTCRPCRNPDVTLESGHVPFQLFGTQSKFATIFIYYILQHQRTTNLEHSSQTERNQTS